MDAAQWDPAPFFLVQHTLQCVLLLCRVYIVCSVLLGHWRVAFAFRKPFTIMDEDEQRLGDVGEPMLDGAAICWLVAS